MGVSSSTEYFSAGDWRQIGSQFGTFGNTSYALDTLYRNENGHRVNNDPSKSFSAKFKQQVTPQGSFYLQSIYNDFESGDLAQYYNEAKPHAGLRVKENQAPFCWAAIIMSGGPGVHTLLLVSRLQDTFQVADPKQPGAAAGQECSRRLYAHGRAYGSDELSQ